MSAGMTIGQRIVVGLLVCLMLTPLLLPFILFSLPDRYEFEGRGWAYWLLVRGSVADRIGLVDPAPVTPVAYSVSFQEGTFPGWTVVRYRSTSSPADVHRAYADRCKTLSFAETKRDVGERVAILTCEIVRYLDIEIHIERPQENQLTDVSLRVWGR